MRESGMTSSSSFNDTPLQSTDDTDHSVWKCFVDDMLSAVTDAKFTVEMPSSDDLTICIRVIPPAQPATPPAPEPEPPKGWVDLWKNAAAAMKQKMEVTDQADFIMNELLPVLEKENALLNRPRFVRQFPTMLAAGLTKAHLHLLFERGLLMASPSFLVMLTWQALQDNKDAKRMEIVNYLLKLVPNKNYEASILEQMIPVSCAGGITFDILEQPASQVHATHLENLRGVKELKRVLQSHEAFAHFPDVPFHLTSWFMFDICQQHDDLLKEIARRVPSTSLPIILLCLSSMIPTGEKEVELAKGFLEEAKSSLPDDSIFLDEWMQSGFNQCSALLNATAERNIQRAQWKKQGLIDVAKQGNLEAVKYLVEECEADVHARDFGGSNAALRYASYYGHLAIVKYLVLKGADVNADDDAALRYASTNGHLEVVRYLVEKCGAHMHAENDYALRWSSTNGHLEVVRWLVECGADVHADDEGALREASMNGHVEVVKYLVLKGADVHAWNDCALQLASMNGHLEMVRYLVEKCDADLHSLNEQALIRASSKGHVQIVKYLVEKGADVHAYHEEALRYASDDGHLEIVRYLVEECGADVHAWNECALRWTCRNGHVQLVQYLVEKCDANVHARNEWALHLASMNGHLDVIRYLVEVGGANVHAGRDFALRAANRYGHLEVVKYLESKGTT
jgi:ankyrin repeat protein